MMLNNSGLAVEADVVRGHELTHGIAPRARQLRPEGGLHIGGIASDARLDHGLQVFDVGDEPVEIESVPVPNEWEAKT